jgi:hypothetical protein
MEQQRKLLLNLELLFWLVTVIITLGVLYPVFSNFDGFPFLWRNILVIVIFITYTRYTFLWQHTLLPKSNIFRAIILVATIPLMFRVIENMNGFQLYLDNEGYDAFMETLKKEISQERQVNLLNYIRSEFVFFSIGAVVSMIALPIRIIMSFWRTRNNRKNS